MNNNTSIIQDEVLAHRLGLVPLTGSREGLHWMEWYEKPADGNTDGVSTDKNTIVLKLRVSCTWAGGDINANNNNNKVGKKDGEREQQQDPKKLYKNAHVYAKDFTFEPVGRQAQFFHGDGVIRAVNPDILLAKMRPGQEIDLEMHCIKGLGADHAKFSPVATASYRLLPSIEIKKPILGEDAKKFARCFPKGVIGLEEVSAEDTEREGSAYEGRLGEKKAVVINPFKDTVSRECLRHEEFEGKVKLGRVRDHFIFTVESTGQHESDLLFLESVKMLKLKCGRMKRSLANIMN